MQALLSNTASGKFFRPEPLFLPTPLVSATVLARHSRLVSEHHGTASVLSRGLPALLADGPGLAHDAGNLLGALGLYCELLARPGVLRDEHRHYAAELELLSGRSRDLINRLLNPATTGRRFVASGSIQVCDQENVIVPDVIEGCRGLLNAVARRAVAVAYGAGSALPVAVSREALERILVNLTKNAADSIEVGSDRAITLRVMCQQEEGAAEQIVLTIEDKGRGMSKAAVKVLMSKPKDATEPRGRHGIGFHVVRELVGASGGQLRLTSRDGGERSGTTVEIAWSVATLVSSSTSPKAQITRRKPMQATNGNVAGETSC